MAVQGSNADAPVQQMLGNVPPRKAECAGYDGLVRVRQVVQLLSAPVQLVISRPRRSYWRLCAIHRG